MKAHSSLQVVAVRSSVEIVVITREMLRERAIELASISGRAPHETCDMDWEQAKKEMSGVRSADTI